MCEGRPKVAPRIATAILTATTTATTTYDSLQSIYKQETLPELLGEQSSSTMSNSDEEEIEDPLLEEMCAVSGCENNNRMDKSSDNQQIYDISRDLEEIAVNVVSPSRNITNKNEGTIVVDYDEGVPDQSRATMLLTGEDCVPNPLSSDCVAFACKPLEVKGNGTCLLTDLIFSKCERRRSLSAASLSSRRRGKSIIFAGSTKSDTLTQSPLQSCDKSETTTSKLERCSSAHKLCLCEVRNHVTMESCWMVANKSVYDVTGMLNSHPGGIRSILRKAGGVDCTEDMQFHSKGARKLLEKCFIGRLQPCGDNVVHGNSGVSCCIM